MANRPVPRSYGGARRWWPHLALAAVAAGFAVWQVILGPLDTFLSWDEAIYATQFSTTVHQIEPSPHRAVGTSLLLAPVTLLTSSIVVMRCYLTVVGAVGLFLAYRCWLAVDVRAAPLGALLFAVLAGTLSVAHIAEPNLPTAPTTVR